MPDFGSVMKHNLSTSLYHLNSAVEAFEKDCQRAENQRENRTQPDSKDESVVAVEYKAVVDMAIQSLIERAHQAQ